MCSCAWMPLLAFGVVVVGGAAFIFLVLNLIGRKYG